MSEPTRKRILSTLSAEFVVGLVIQLVIILFAGYRLANAMDQRITTLEAQKVDPVAVGQLQTSVENLSTSLNRLQVELERLREVMERQNRQRVDRSR